MAYKSWTIAASGTTSGVVDLGVGSLAAIQFPSTMTGANVYVYGMKADGTTFSKLYDDTGAELSVVITAGALVSVYRDDYKAYRKIKIVSDATESSARTGYVLTDAFADDGTPL